MIRSFQRRHTCSRIHAHAHVRLRVLRWNEGKARDTPPGSRWQAGMGLGRPEDRGKEQTLAF